MVTLELVTLGGVKFKESVHQVSLPTPEGTISIYQGHAPLMSVASEGVISVRYKSTDPDDFMEHFASHGGIIDIQADRVRVLVDEADLPDEIIEAEAQEALQNAKDALRDSKDSVSLAKAQSLVDRSKVRLHVAKMRRRSRR